MNINHFFKEKAKKIIPSYKLSKIANSEVTDRPKRNFIFLLLRNLSLLKLPPFETLLLSQVQLVAFRRIPIVPSFR